MTTKKTVIGVDLGGTKVAAARVNGTDILQLEHRLIDAQGSADSVLQEVIDCIRAVWSPQVDAIGVGVPSIVDIEKGIVYDVQNIPSWKEVPLKAILEAEFSCPAGLNNDANCFALGEQYFGEGQGSRNMIGLIIGTGMAGGIIIDGQLYNGHNCGAGEFGMLPYLDHHLEYYASGQYFQRIHGIDGATVHERARQGDATSLRIMHDYGYHLGNGILMILYTYDPELIVLGGSVSKAYGVFAPSLRERLTTFAYPTVLKNLQFRVSNHPNIAVLGAASLMLEPDG